VVASQESPGRQIRASSIRAKSSYEARQKLKDGREVKGFFNLVTVMKKQGCGVTCADSAAAAE